MPGVAFRETGVFTTDAAGFSPNIGEAYPTTLGGVVQGWPTNRAASARDRATSYSPKLAGINFVANGGTAADYRIDVTPGTYEVRLGLGDATNTQLEQRVVIKDGPTTRATVSAAAVAVGEYVDATSVIRTGVTWDATNQATTVLISSGQLILSVGDPGGSGNTTITHVEWTLVGGDSTPPIISGPGGSVGATSSASVAVGATAVHTFAANEAVTWSLNGGANAALFSIGSSSGDLVYNVPAVAGVHVVVVRATDAATPTANTTDQTVTVTVAAPAAPTINTHPSNQTVTSPTAATFTVSASGTGLSYQWQRNPGGNTSFGNISGATSTSYTTGATAVTGGSHNNTDTYRVVVINGGGSVNSNAATLTVNAPSSTGTLTLTAPLCNNTGQLSGLWASQTGIRLSILNEATGATVLVVTGRSTNSSGVLTAAVTDAAIVSGQTYRISPSFGGNAGLSHVLTAT